MVKICGIEFTNSEVEKIINNLHERCFIIKYNTIFQLYFSKNCGLYAREVYKKQKNNRYDVPLVKRGRFIITNAKHCNELIGRELFV